MSEIPETQYYRQENFQVEGGTLPIAVTAYRTHGDPSNPCIVFPTCYGGRLDSQYYFVGEGKVLDTKKYFVVTFALFSNGESSSPSNTPAPHNGPYFPQISYADNIRAQHAVITKVLGISKSDFRWEDSRRNSTVRKEGVLVERYGKLIRKWGSFLEGPKAALVSARDYQFGHYLKNPEVGLRAFGRGGKYRSLEAFMRAEWESGFLNWDANDLLTLMHTWYSGDISKVNHQGDLESALKSIQVKGQSQPEDNEYEVSILPNSRFVVIDSVWGHVAGGGADKGDLAFMEEQITKFLEEEL
ncbi:hypothetical protein Clacol_003380 [Clathrus columnatus]|uniref:Uncharacterized protein n=1 Tax=Clathrus columnatus TaxID=1419009 RepID=A0AAV5A7G7_9AGAM|nr:hypothetical protein Clacol_003380 [Clathrus columnatus]